MKGPGRSRNVKEGQGRSRKVKEGHGWSIPTTRLTFQVRKVMGGGGVVACRIIQGVPKKTVILGHPVVSALVPVPLDLGFGTWIWDWTWA